MRGAVYAIPIPTPGRKPYVKATIKNELFTERLVKAMDNLGGFKKEIKTKISHKKLTKK